MARTNRLAEPNIVTGLEPLGLKELGKKAFDGTNLTLNGARALLLSSALDRQSSHSNGTGVAGGGGALDQVMAAMESGGDVLNLKPIVT